MNVPTNTPLEPEESDDEKYQSASDKESIVGSEDDLDSPSTPLTPASQSKNFRANVYKCPYEDCNRKFNRPCRLAEHLRSHTNERPYKCHYDGCNKDFRRDTHLTRHIKSAHSEERDFACTWPDCDKKFLNGTRLRRHLEGHEQKEKFRCTAYAPCNEVFRKHSTLQSHIATVHLQQKPYCCTHVDAETGEQCDKGYFEQSKLKAHVAKAHSGWNRYSCSICALNGGQTEDEDASMQDDMPSEAERSSNAVSFPTYSALQDHIREVHPPKCECCQDTFLTQRELARHIDLIHSDPADKGDQALFACEEPGCNKAFTKRGNLKEHIRIIHKGEKRFVCGTTDVSGSSKFVGEDGQRRGWEGDGCGRSFGTKASLEEHIRTQHLGMEGTSKVKKRLRLIEARRDPTAVSAMGKGGPKQRKDKGVSKQKSALSRLAGAEVIPPNQHFQTFDDERFWVGGYDDDGATGMFQTPHERNSTFDWDAAARQCMMFDDQDGTESLPAVDIHRADNMPWGVRNPVPVDPALEAVSSYLHTSS